ncbi:MAG: hypothetical protein IPM29_27245 [Planctomycetes bacterium]|nr:hypothetical protein [Planctomycetota bacterium]
MCGVAIGIGDQVEDQRLGRSGRAVLDRQDDVVAVAGEVGIAVADRVQIAAAAQRLAGLRALLLAGVVDEHHGGVEAALEVADVAEQSGDLRGAVLVEAVQPHERIEEQEPGSEPFDGFGEPLLIAAQVEPQDRCGDDVEIERRDVDAAVVAQRFDARADLGQAVLGQVDEGRTAGAGLEMTERSGAGCDADREVEAEPCLAALGRPADQADGGAGPQSFDEPALLGWLGLETGGTDDRKRGRDHGHSSFRAWTTCIAWHTSWSWSCAISRRLAGEFVGGAQVASADLEECVDAAGVERVLDRAGDRAAVFDVAVGLFAGEPAQGRAVRQPPGDVLELVASQHVAQRRLAGEDHAEDEAAVHVEVGQQSDHRERLDAEVVMPRRG